MRHPEILLVFRLDVVFRLNVLSGMFSLFSNKCILKLKVGHLGGSVS